MRHSRKTPPKPQTALTSILVSGGSQASRAASQLSLGSREHKVAGRFWLLGSVPLLVPSGGHVKADKPKFWRGGGGGRGEKRGCDPSSLASYTLLSGPACHWSFDTGPFLVLKTLAALGPGASGSRPLHGDRTETLMTWAGLQLHLSIKGGGGRLPFSTLLRTHFFGLEGVRDPSSPPRYSLKISGGCFSLSAQLTVHWSHPRAEVDQHPSSEHSIPGSSWSGCNLESAWGSHCLPFLCGLFLPQMWPPQLTQLRACRGEVGGCSFFAFCFCWGL